MKMDGEDEDSAEAFPLRNKGDFKRIYFEDKESV